MVKLNTFSVCIANLESNKVLVLHAPAVSTFALSDEVEVDGPPMGMKKTLKFDKFAKDDESKYDEVVFERPCGHEVESL